MQLSIFLNLGVQTHPHTTCCLPTYVPALDGKLIFDANILK